MKKEKRRKVAITVTAGAVTVCLLFAGTFAWQSISQQTVNKKIIEVNPGGRLHDDWNGKTKSVYVENFTNPEEDDSSPIFVRVRMQEYMETGEEAGDKENPDRKKKVILEYNYHWQNKEK